ncbi:hypothetical protein [Streptomyces sp. SJL17-4]|uniref:hypothetical protein n=1 Tax=Streptomyces sp. SJL17-4 TaxID=2967224 RepID=UPI0030CE6FE4
MSEDLDGKATVLESGTDVDDPRACREALLDAISQVTRSGGGRPVLLEDRSNEYPAARADTRRVAVPFGSQDPCHRRPVPG